MESIYLNTHTHTQTDTLWYGRCVFCVCAGRYILDVRVTESACVCNYVYRRVCVYVHIDLNVFSILYTSGNLHSVLSLGRRLADPHPNAYLNPV